LTYAYDANGNRTVLGGTWARTGLPAAVASATYNAANHQLTFGSATLTYDLNGNLSNDGTSTYTWDARNRLVAISGSNTVSFQHDAQGRRTSKTINSAQTDFLYDGLTPVQELNGTTVVANLLTGLGIDEYLTRTDTGGTGHFLTDALGSTVALSDGTGAVPTTYTYAPFGAASMSGTATANAFDYTGRENDGTGLHYYRARYYHPTLQRFISEDPIGFRGGMNLYAYVGNRPTWAVDPRGLDLTISKYRCCIRFNHVGIGINVDSDRYTVGFYPTVAHTPFNTGVVMPDSVRNRHDEFLDEFLESITIKTTPEQDRAVQDFINARTANPGFYALSGRHCGDFVQDALRAAGIDPFEDVLSPDSFFKGLQAMKASGVDFSAGVGRRRAPLQPESP
jgi:RHS repeat-associated protein